MEIMSGFAYSCGECGGVNGQHYCKCQYYICPSCAALRARVEVLEKGLMAVEGLIGESRGVDGLHLNGDVAPWEDLRTGGVYEEWLRDYDAALDALKEG